MAVGIETAPGDWPAAALTLIIERSTSESVTMTDLDELDDATAAAAFRRLVRHLRHRTDAQNIDLMGLAGFCRNCLSDWIEEAGGLEKGVARQTVYGMPQAEWKARFQTEATPEQLARMADSMTRNPPAAAVEREAVAGLSEQG
jgi:hypothetical protein